MVTLANISAEALLSILSSKPITLLPSGSDSPIYIHERLLGSVEWKESKSRVYKFLKDDDGFDVTKDLLICFVRWAYIGDYSTELVGISSFVEERVVAEDVVEEDDWDFGSSKRKKGKNRGKQDIYVDEIPPATPEALSDKHDQLDSGEEGLSIRTTNTVDPLSLHIQLYVFANIYLIDALKDKVERSTLKAPYTTMIFSLLEYASLYLSNDDPLLNWLGRYASWNLSTLRQNVRRLENLLGDGKFATLLVRHVVPSQTNPFICAS
ncbi:hypothetical protein DL98DRAFT_522744 [Cadophora sp. DSE1049]|nr:hypothetical protein DL98DRAFT_522744 [Cadophora sp. DSE1049]